MFTCPLLGGECLFRQASTTITCTLEWQILTEIRSPGTARSAPELVSSIHSYARVTVKDPAVARGVRAKIETNQFCIS